ncbi:MAG: plantaricin C family lantibiotic [Acidobacteriota bacterium]
MLDVVRAWKDPVYRASLSLSDKEKLPDHPSGDSWSELDEDDLDSVAGGANSAELEAPTVPTIVNSGGHVCTATTECPVLSFCCSS